MTYLARIYCCYVATLGFLIVFNTYWIKEDKRVRYVLLLLAIEAMSLSILVATSPAVSDIRRRIQIYGPTITSLCVGVPTVAFDRHEPLCNDQTGQKC
jgi:hypothetical protein